MATLYEIDKQIFECVDEETGEILDLERLNSLNIERTAKIENVALYIKELISDAEAIKTESDSLMERVKSKKAKADRLKEWLVNVLDGTEFETPRVKLGFRKSQKVKIEDDASLLEWLEKNDNISCIKYKSPEISKTELTKLLKQGIEIPYAILETSQNLQIKQEG